MSFNKVIEQLKGGAGSGNFGHSGRPGKLGGSVGGGKGGGLGFSKVGVMPITRNGQEMPVKRYVQINLHEPGTETTQYEFTGDADRPGVTKWDKSKITKGFGAVTYHDKLPESSQLMREHSAFISSGDTYLSAPLAAALGISGPEHASIGSTDYIRANPNSFRAASVAATSERDVDLINYLSKL